jgi:hypothetical protein
MLKKIGLGVVVLLAVFLTYVSTRDGHFHYERNGVIKASKDKIYPYISNLRMGEHWSPYEKVDPNLKKTFAGNDGQIGSSMEFEGNSDVGSGKLEITGLVPNEKVEMKLTMTKPVYGENHIVYNLTEEAEGTRFSWAMSGDGGYLTKLMSALIDCEKMVGDMFIIGIENLKKVTENPK